MIHQKEMGCDAVYSRCTGKAVILGRTLYGDGQKFQDRSTAAMRNLRLSSLGRDVGLQLQPRVGDF